MRSDTWLITVAINGVLFPASDNGVWDTFKGGDITSAASTYRAGAMQDQEVVGGQATIGPVTCDKSLDLQNDWAALQELMASGVGNAPITIHRQPLDINKNPYGTPLTYSGIVSALNAGDTDSTKSDVQMWTLSAVVSGPLGTS